MAIVFTYTKSTNIAAVTGGTSGTPATFADFVTADRAGSVTLLAAWAPISNVKALTYQITPVEKLALLISFVVAAKTAEPDYIFITGTDAWDAAQTESINVSAGNGTYVSTKRFRTITNIDCSDNPAGGGTLWANGTVEITQPQWGVVWNFGSNHYHLDCNFTIGDASTATYFTSFFEMFSFKAGMIPSVKAGAVFTLGKLQNDWGKQGSTMQLNGPAGADWAFNSGGTILIYASKIDNIANSRPKFNTGTLTVKNSLLLSNYGDYDTAEFYRSFSFLGTTISIEDLFYSDCHAFFTNVVPTLFSNVHLHYTLSGLYSCAGSVVSASGVRITNSRTRDAWNQLSGSNINMIDPVSGLGTVQINTAGDWIKEQYTCNINICDKNGVPISGAVIDCVDKFDTAVWAAGTISTDASGNISQQIITYKQWIDTTETLTTYSPHKFTISKAGYQTLVLENITVSAPIKWHLELQDPATGGGSYLRRR